VGTDSMMAPGKDLLAFDCREEDLDVLRGAVGPKGPALHVVSSPVQAAHLAMARRPLALILGLRKQTLSNLEVIPVIRAARGDLPVIVIGSRDSLEVEKAARQIGIFYYLVHPLDPAEVHAVLKVVLRGPASRK